FLSARPNFVRLIEREALSGNGPLEGGTHRSAGQEALAAISDELGLDESPSGDAAQLLLSVIALCWFPLVHAHTVAPAVGVTFDHPADFERRKQHVVDLVVHGLRGLINQTSSSLTERASHD